MNLKTLEKKERKNLCFVKYCRNKYFAVWHTIDGEYYLLCKKHSLNELKAWLKMIPKDFKSYEDLKNNLIGEGMIDKNELEILQKCVGSEK